MGTMESHFRRPKIAWFSCDTNISHICRGKKKNNRQNTEAQNIPLTKSCTRFLASIKLKFSTWNREGAVNQFLEMSSVPGGHVESSACLSHWGNEVVTTSDSLYLFRLKTKFWLVSFS